MVGRQTCDRELASSTSGRSITASSLVQPSFHPSGVGKSSIRLRARVRAGRVHLCWVAGNTVAGIAMSLRAMHAYNLYLFNSHVSEEAE